jgi:ATP-dependent Clp endopeptidase proteolytic subunit ClpP
MDPAPFLPIGEVVQIINPIDLNPTYLDDEIANQLIGIMMYLNGEDKSKDMYLYINSPGGAVLAGISVYDVMQFVVPV